MEFENLDFYDKKSLIDYTNKIRNEINNGLEDLRKRYTKFDRLLLERELNLFNNIKSNIRVNEEEDDPEKEVKRLSNLIEIFSLLESLSFHNHCFKNEVNLIKSLINGDLKNIYLLNIIFILQSMLL